MTSQTALNDVPQAIERVTWSNSDRITKDDLERVERESKDGHGWPMVRTVCGNEFYFDPNGIIHLGRSCKPEPLRETEERILRAVSFLSMVLRDRKKSIVKVFDVSTYAIKHIFEPEFGYVSNGATIEAAGRLGIPLAIDNRATINPLLPISWAWLERYQRGRALALVKLDRLRMELKDWLDDGIPMPPDALNGHPGESTLATLDRLERAISIIRRSISCNETGVSEVAE